DRTAAGRVANRMIGETVSVQKVRVTKGSAVIEAEIPLTAPIDHAKMGRPVDKAYEQNRNMVLNRLADIGVATATVVNFLPFDLTSCSTLDPLRKARVKGVKEGQEYSTYVITKCHLEPAGIGADAPLGCYDFHPIPLCRDFSESYANTGAVFAFVGLPEDIQKPDWPHREVFNLCKQRAVDYMHREYAGAKALADKKQFGSILESMKLCTKRLFELGYLKTMPEDIVNRQRDAAVAVPKCQSCQRPSEPNSVRCTNQGCRYIIDPKRAYEVNEIDESHESLERLTRKEVTEMGISDYVAETADEKPARIRMGIPKPLSKPAQRIVEAEEAESERKRKADHRAMAEAVRGAAGKKNAAPVDDFAEPGKDKE